MLSVLLWIDVIGLSSRFLMSSSIRRIDTSSLSLMLANPLHPFLDTHTLCLLSDVKLCAWSTFLSSGLFI